MAVAAIEVKCQQQQREGPPTPAAAAISAGGSSSGAISGAPLSPAAKAQPPGRDPPLTRQPAPATATSGGGSGAQALEGVAQELYRVLLFLVFSAEVLALSCVPYLGPAVNVVFLSWLYAFYCFDYSWSLQGVPLPERLAFFERRWAFFAGGFGVGGGLGGCWSACRTCICCSTQRSASQGTRTPTPDGPHQDLVSRVPCQRCCCPIRLPRRC